jgi:hypothetical protein
LAVLLFGFQKIVNAYVGDWVCDRLRYINA